MKKIYLLMLAVATMLPAGQSSAITRQKLQDYAQSLRGLKKESLKAALTKLMNNKHVLGYGSGSGKTWSGFYKTDRDPETNECYNRYSSKKFYFSNGNTKNAISGMNIEHSFPKSWWGGDKNQAYKDLYNLYPSDSKANSSKSNYPMDDVSNGAPNPGYDKVGAGAHTSKAWEPGDRFKGDFSRSYMYMGVTYANLHFSGTGSQTMANNSYPGMKTWATTLYRKWSKKDKIDELEVRRNNAVADIQGNRNLFIDFPFLAEYVWGDSVDVAFNPQTAITTASDDSRYGSYTPSPDDPDEPDTPTGNFIWAKLTADPVAGHRYLIVAEKDGNGIVMQTLKSGKRYGYINPQTLPISDGTIKTTNDDLAFTFEEANGGFYIKGSDGKYYYNESGYNTFTTGSMRPSDVWTVTRNSDGTFFIVYEGHIIQYTTKYGTFSAYASEQTGAIYPTLFEESQPTGISTIASGRKTYTNDEAVYTLQGVRVSDGEPLQPGIYIRGGKKFVQR